MRINLHLILILLFNIYTYAGQETGNGGGVFACENSDREIIPDSVVLQDIAEINEDYQVIDSPLYYEQLAFEQLEKLNEIKRNDLYDGIKKYLLEVMSIIEFVDHRIDVVGDELFRGKQFSCDTGKKVYLQLAVFNDENETLKVDQMLFENMNNISKAGLLLHEAIYLYFRKSLGVSTSVLPRQFVAFLLSNQTQLDLNTFYNLEFIFTEVDKNNDLVVRGDEVYYLLEELQYVISLVYGNEYWELILNLQDGEANEYGRLVILYVLEHRKLPGPLQIWWYKKKFSVVKKKYFYGKFKVYLKDLYKLNEILNIN